MMPRSFASAGSSLVNQLAGGLLILVLSFPCTYAYPYTLLYAYLYAIAALVGPANGSNAVRLNPAAVAQRLKSSIV